MKNYNKELLTYAVSAFILSIPLQIFVDVMSKKQINAMIWPYIWGGFVFSVLMTLFKFISDKRKKH